MANLSGPAPPPDVVLRPTRRDSRDQNPIIIRGECLEQSADRQHQFETSSQLSPHNQERMPKDPTIMFSQPRLRIGSLPAECARESAQAMATCMARKGAEKAGRKRHGEVLTSSSTSSSNKKPQITVTNAIEAYVVSSSSRSGLLIPLLSNVA